MPVFKRNDLPKLLTQARQGQVSPVYLVVGDRFLCQTAAQELIEALLPDPADRRQRCRNIDGAIEDPEATLRHLRTYSLLPGRQVIKVTDSLLLSSKTDAKSLWDKAAKAQAAGDSRRAAQMLAKLCGLVELRPAELLTMAAEDWKAQLSFERPADLGWLKDIVGDPTLTSGPGTQSGAGDMADRFTETFEKGIPAGNVLVLTAETADRRKKFYKFISGSGTVVDLAADLAGSTTAARKEQDDVLRGLARETLKQFGKSMAEEVLKALLDRVGFHPVAVVMETEKLALSVGEARAITIRDLDTMIGRTRETALYELNEVFAGRDLNAMLLRLSRLQEDGMHPLAIVAGLRNLIKKLMLVAAVQKLPAPVYTPLPYPAFQKDYLPRLKASLDPWPKALDGHPYALHMVFRQAEKFSVPELQKGLKLLLETEYRLKGSQLPPSLAIESFLLAFFLEPEAPAPAGNPSRRPTT